MFRLVQIPAIALLASASFFLGAPVSSFASGRALLGPSADLVAKDIPFRRLARASGDGPFVHVNAFSDTVPLSPATTSYAGPIFFGGYAFSSSSFDVGLTRQQIRNDRALHGSVNDTITLQAFRSGGWADSVLTLHGAFVFKLDGSTEEQLDGISLAWSGSGNAEPGRAPFSLDGRLVVQKGAAYYVSDTRFPLVAMRGEFTIASPALGSVRWARYEPAIRLGFSPPPAGFESLDLAGVTAVGIYFENKGWLGSASANAAFTLELVRVEAETRAAR